MDTTGYYRGEFITRFLDFGKARRTQHCKYLFTSSLACGWSKRNVIWASATLNVLCVICDWADPSESNEEEVLGGSGDTARCNALIDAMWSCRLNMGIPYREEGWKKKGGCYRRIYILFWAGGSLNRQTSAYGRTLWKAVYSELCVMIFSHACGMALQMHCAVSQLVGFGPDWLSTIIGWKFSATVLDSQMNLNDLACGLRHPHDDILTRKISQQMLDGLQCNFIHSFSSGWIVITSETP